MNTQFKVILLIVVIFIIYRAFRFYSIIENNDLTYHPGKEHVKVSVYYESLCPDSKFFILYQLLPVYKEMHEIINLDLIPYGKARTIEVNENIIFECQHDAIECYANKIHSCAVEYIKDPLTQLKYISCMISNNRVPEFAGQKCGDELNITFAPILDCAKGEQGIQLLKENGKRTHKIHDLKFIPTIFLNDSPGLVAQTDILKDLLKSICSILKFKPNKCY